MILLCAAMMEYFQILEELMEELRFISSFWLSVGRKVEAFRCLNVPVLLKIPRGVVVFVWRGLFMLGGSRTL